VFDHPSDVDDLVGGGGVDGGEEHGGAFDVVVDGGGGRWGAVEPVEELADDGGVAFEVELDGGDFLGAEAATALVLLDTDDVVAI